MRDIVVSAILIVVGVIGLTKVDTVEQLYAAAYPESAAQSRALDRCAASNNEFDRLDAMDRAGCYARLRVPPPSVQPMGATNEPKDDIRRLQATQH